MILLDDVHSQLNPTCVDRVLRPASVDDVRAAVAQARQRSQPLSIAGGRHAMGGQQFASGALHLDMTGLADVIDADAERGLLHIGAGATWPRIMAAANAMRAPDATRAPTLAAPRGGCPGFGLACPELVEGAGHRAWAIRQKQTGVDEVTLGGSIAANAHGRGLLMRPLVDDVESLVVVDAQGRVLRASRDENAELFSLVAGGYGLFGVVVSATLRLMPRQRVQRLVDVLDLRDAMHAVRRRVDDGCIYGDFQFAIDPRDRGFLDRGVFACYRPVDESASGADDDHASADLSSTAWLELLRLAHTDKAAAFRLYAQHYVGTHGRTYWADAMQLATYIPSYADFLARADDTTSASRETLVIGEHYVPRERIAAYMERAREVLLRTGSEVIYGTIRSILRDDTSFLPWARDDYACVVFNLRTPHTDAGRARTAEAFRGLIQAALDLGGSFFLTYHRHATRAQLLRAHPRLPEFLARKLEYDPGEVFQSDWYRHVRDLIAST